MTKISIQLSSVPSEKLKDIMIALQDMIKKAGAKIDNVTIVGVREGNVR